MPLKIMLGLGGFFLVIGAGIFHVGAAFVAASAVFIVGGLLFYPDPRSPKVEP